MKTLEARARIELANKGFADLSLTTWVPRPTCHTRTSVPLLSRTPLRKVKIPTNQNGSSRTKPNYSLH
jgi:hypothetical protein